MIEWLMVFAGGLLGSAHCVGMCGAFALALGGSLRRQLVYGLGRVFTYTVGGVAAGYGGWRLTGELRPLVNVQSLLAIVAGAVLVVQGLASAGVLRLPARAGSGPCLTPSLFGSLLSATRLHSVFLGGVVNGFLPCGLVYGYLALAASAGNLFNGGATMALFGLGTLPALALVGRGGQLLTLAARRKVLHAAAWLVVLTGVVAMARGFGFLDFSTTPAEPTCPYCQ